MITAGLPITMDPGKIMELNPMKLNSHVKLVEKYRLYHRAVAEKLRRNPALLEIPRTNLSRWIENEEKQTGSASPCLHEWKTLLEKSTLTQIMEILEGMTGEADRLQHASPFAGVLSQEERNSIFMSEHETLSA